jgi:hypothetical protein
VPRTVARRIGASCGNLHRSVTRALAISGVEAPACWIMRPAAGSYRGTDGGRAGFVKITTVFSSR